jgi:methyl-accepting chemotaxis protein
MTTNLWTKVTVPSFKNKVTLIAIAVGVIPAILIGGLNYNQVANRDRQQTIKIQKSRAEAIADKLNRFVFERNGDVEIISSLPIFTDTKISGITSPQSKSQLLDRFVTSYQVYDSIAVFDIKGNLIAQSKGESLTKINHLQRQYFQDALKTGKTVISSPEVSKDTGRNSVFFAAPIRDSITNQIIGVVRTRTPVEKLAVPLKDYAGKSEDYHIFDARTGKVFVSSNGDYSGKLEDRDLKKARETGELVAHQNKFEHLPGTPVNPNDTSNHVELMTAAPFQKIEGMEQLPWTAFAVIDEDVSSASLNALLLTILTATGLTTLFTITLSTLFADRITKYLQRAIGTITTSASEIIDTVQSQEITVNQQANSAITTTDTVNQLESISTETAAQAQSSATGAQQALSLAEEGTQSVQQTLEGMSGLRDRVDEIAEQIVNLGEQTKQITTVSDLVSDLAKQTNMLALKAAVEAARVGEQGKGFGVVAGEIRKLAEESKKSAEKINNLATDIQIAINRTVMVTDRGSKTVMEGIQLAQNTAATFLGVTDAVNNVFLNSQQISASAKQQATAIQQVLGEMTIISQGSQESAVGMHRVKTSTRELNQIADELQAVVN